MWTPKLSAIMMIPRKKMEYIAPFFRYRYVLTRSTLRSVSSRTTKAPIPFPMRMRGTERVKAKAPRTPSIEKVRSMISRYRILLRSDIVVDVRRFSFSSALCLKPFVMKKAVEPTTAEKPMSPLRCIENQTTRARKIDATA